jgi:hypothetical protein
MVQKCFSWPDCRCGQNLASIDPKISEWISNPISREEIINVMGVLYCVLRCIETHSSRPSVRQSATLQLLHPVWKELPPEFRR